MFRLSKDNNDTTSGDLGAVVLEKDPEVKEPPSYQVILLNDDYTPMEFVVYVLQVFFGFDGDKAQQNYVGCSYTWQGSLWYLYSRGC